MLTNLFSFTNRLFSRHRLPRRRVRSLPAKPALSNLTLLSVTVVLLACSDADPELLSRQYQSNHARLMALARAQPDAPATSHTHPSTCTGVTPIAANAPYRNIDEFLLSQLHDRQFGCSLRTVSTTVQNNHRLQANSTSDIVAWSPSELSDSIPAMLLAVHYDSQPTVDDLLSGMWPAAAAFEILDERERRADSQVPVIVTMTDLSRQRTWNPPPLLTTNIYSDTMQIVAWANLPRISPPMVFADAPGWMAARYSPRYRLDTHLLFAPVIPAQSSIPDDARISDVSQLSDVDLQLLPDGSFLAGMEQYHEGGVVDAQSIASQIVLAVNALAQGSAAGTAWFRPTRMQWIAITSVLGFLLLAVFLSLRGQETVTLTSTFDTVERWSKEEAEHAEKQKRAAGDAKSVAEEMKASAEISLEGAKERVKEAIKDVEMTEKDEREANKEHERRRERLRIAQTQLAKAKSEISNTEEVDDAADRVTDRFIARLLSGLRRVFGLSAGLDEPGNEEEKQKKDKELWDDHSGKGHVEEVHAKLKEMEINKQEEEMEFRRARTTLDEMRKGKAKAEDVLADARRTLADTTRKVESAETIIKEAKTKIEKEKQLEGYWKDLEQAAKERREKSTSDISKYRSATDVIVTTIKEARGAGDLMWGAVYFVGSLVVSVLLVRSGLMDPPSFAGGADSGSVFFLDLRAMGYLVACAAVSCMAVSLAHVIRTRVMADRSLRKTAEERLVSVSVGMFVIPILGWSLTLAIPEGSAYTVPRYALLWLSVMVAGMWWMASWKEKILEHEKWAKKLQKRWRRKRRCHSSQGTKMGGGKGRLLGSVRLTLFVTYALVGLSICGPKVTEIVYLEQAGWMEAMVVGILAAGMVAVLFPGLAVVMPLRMLNPKTVGRQQRG